MWAEYRKDILGSIISGTIGKMVLLPGVDPDLLFKRLFERATNRSSPSDYPNDYIGEVATLANREMLQIWRDGFADPYKLSHWRQQVANHLVDILNAPWYGPRKEELLSICYGKLETGPPPTYDPTRSGTLKGYLRGLVRRTHLELRCARAIHKHVSLDDIANQLADKRKDSDPCYDALAREARDDLERKFREECHDDLDHRILDRMLQGKGPAEIARELGEPEEKIKKRVQRLIQRVGRHHQPDQ
jgi:DNA-directed RNA polymerase specialized sigma24 family protein